LDGHKIHVIGMRPTGGTIAPNGKALALFTPFRSKSLLITTAEGVPMYAIRLPAPTSPTDAPRPVCRFSPSSQLLAIANGPHAWLLDVSTGVVERSMCHPQHGFYTDLAFVPGASVLALVGNEVMDSMDPPLTGTMELWSAHENLLMQRHQEGLCDFFAIAQGGTLEALTVRSSSEILYRCDLGPEPEKGWKGFGAFEYSHPTAPTYLQGGIASSVRNTTASVSSDGFVDVFRADDGTRLSRTALFDCKDGSIKPMQPTYSGDGQFLATGYSRHGREAYLCVYETAPETEQLKVRKIIKLSCDQFATAFSPDSTRVAALVMECPKERSSFLAVLDLT
jgi:hypothetical protein